MQAQGRNAQEAVSNLVSQAIAQGGVKAQDPSARALGAASQMKGDVVSNLVGMGRGDFADSRIRQLQAQGESKGYTPDLRNAINSLRMGQSNMAQDARSMKSLDFKPSGGGRSSSGGGFSVAQGDDLSTIAQLLAQYEGNLDYNKGLRGSVGLDHNYNNDITTQDSSMVGRLKPIYEELMKQKRMQTDLLSQQLRNSQQSQVIDYGGAQPPSEPRLGRDMRGNIVDPNRSWHNGNDLSRFSFNSQYHKDPVREEAIQAALRALASRYRK